MNINMSFYRINSTIMIQIIHKIIEQKPEQKPLILYSWDDFLMAPVYVHLLLQAI